MGEPPRRGRGVQQHATDSIPLASFVRNTGDLWGKGSGAHSTQRTRKLCPRRTARGGWCNGSKHG
jgi:hypothetical protein